MRIAIGCDHAGPAHRDEIKRFLESRGHTVQDFGCPGGESCDYPDIALPLARSVARGENDRGILLCGTGIGMSIAANKVRGIRAAVCWSDEVAGLVSEHNNANVLCLGARFAEAATMVRWIDAWLSTPASREDRHVRRLDKIREAEGR